MKILMNVINSLGLLLLPLLFCMYVMVIQLMGFILQIMKAISQHRDELLKEAEELKSSQINTGV